MMDWTDRWCRLFHRGLTHRALLFTEMVVDQAILKGPRARLLEHDPTGNPVALQLGGHDAGDLAEAARYGQAAGYVEVNLNCGCPSDRVQDGRIGACLMLEPETVARAVEAMASAVQVPVTVKCRLGVDDQAVEATLPRFLSLIADAGVGRVYLHARKAWLKGLSPKENRDIPPLDYECVRHMKALFPRLQIILNGGLTTPSEALQYMDTLDGVMFGRAAYQNPFALTEVDALYFGESSEVAVTRTDAVEHLVSVAEIAAREGQPLHRVTRHALGLFNGVRGARAWRRGLTELAQADQQDPACILALAEKVMKGDEITTLSLATSAADA